MGFFEQFKDKKTLAKLAISVATIGVTVTTVFVVYKIVKKQPIFPIIPKKNGHNSTTEHTDKDIK